MNSKVVQPLAWGLIILGGVISILFMISASVDGLWIWGNSNIDFQTTGQFGDFIGGVVGTVFSLAGTILIILTFREQSKQNKRVAFESAFFLMLNLHRENVSEMNYTKYGVSELETSRHRKVFRVILQEFLDCYREIKHFSNSRDINDYILPKYQIYLNSLLRKNKLRANLIDLAVIDIAYSIVFFGVGNEGEIILRNKFKSRYQNPYMYHVLKYIKLKPKKENFSRWETWKDLISMDYKQFKTVFEEYYNFKNRLSKESLSPEAAKLLFDKEYSKYYNGHQHRLGHYFRHLFQTYKFLNFHQDLTADEKYFYGKMLRAQLSTHEQALLFINSISSLGMKWELEPELPEKNINKIAIEDCKLITKYQLIKNLPGRHLYGIRFKTYYPKINYESSK